MILSATLFLLAVICYSIKELTAFNKLKWQTSDNGFWGYDSYIRKYKVNNGRGLERGNGWYYRFFKIKYKERFPLSATLLVFLTDGFHLMQWTFKIMFCSAFYPLTNWWFPFILWLLWAIVWNLCDRYLTK